MGSLGDGNGSVLSLFPICCPQPRRIASQGLTKKSKATKMLSMVEKELSEACEEIRSILCGAPAKSTATILPSLSCGDLSVYDNFDSPFPSGRFSSSSDEIRRQMSDDTDILSGTYSKKENFLKKEEIQKSDIDLTVRPILSDSFPSFPSSENDKAVEDGAFPAQTPPLRSHNPLPFNSPFSTVEARGGIEFGLLSISPPLFDDEDVTFEVSRARRTTLIYDDSDGERNCRNSTGDNFLFFGDF